MLLEECPVDVQDLATLEKMFWEHRPRLLAMVERRSDPALSARRSPEDILSDAYVKAHDRWDDFKQSGMTEYSWLYQIVLNCLFDDHTYQSRERRNYHREMAIPDRSSLQLVIGLVSPLTSPSDTVANEELQERLRQQIAQTMEMLKPEQREILHMHFYDLLATREIAMVLNIGEGAVRARYTRARLRFRDLWMKLHGNEGLEG